MPESTETVGAVLEQDHHRIDAHFAAFARSLGDGEVDSDSLTAASTALRRHIYVEEAYHFPPLREAGLLGPIMVMLREHGEIWDLLDALDAGLREDAAAADLAATWRALEAVLSAHNAKEERILYPTGDQVLSAEVVADVLTGLSEGETPAGWACELAARR